MLASAHEAGAARFSVEDEAGAARLDKHTDTPKGDELASEAGEVQRLRGSTRTNTTGTQPTPGSQYNTPVIQNKSTLLTKQAYAYCQGATRGVER